MATGKVRATLRPDRIITTATITADGKILALGCKAPAFHGLELWPVAASKALSE
jgi:hypothetical protein